VKKIVFKRPESWGEAIAVGGLCLTLVIALLALYHQLLFKSWEYQHPWPIATIVTGGVVWLFKLILLGDPYAHIPIEKRSWLTRWLLED
jgi:hypothetical protein